MYEPKKRHDLESLVKTILYLFYKIDLPNFPKFADIKEEIEETVKMTKSWWMFIEDWLKKMGVQGEFWTKAFLIVRNESECMVLDELERHFLKNLVIFDRDLTVNKFEEYYSEWKMKS